MKLTTDYPAEFQVTLMLGKNGGIVVQLEKSVTKDIVDRVG